MGEHLFGAFKIGDDTADERCPDGDIATLAASHLSGLEAICDYLVGHLIDRDERRFI